MPLRPYLIVLGFVAVGCTDSLGPPSRQSPPLTEALHLLRWAGDATPHFTASGTRLGTGAFQGATADGISLSQNTVTFWAVRGQERSVQINYQSGGDTTHPFLRLTISDPIYVPGVGDLAPGDSVLVSVAVDPQTISVSFEPTGLLFGTPSPMQLWYAGAGGDLNGDGVVDSTDTYIESQLLGMVGRELPTDQWAKISTTQSLVDQSFTTGLQHFSQYAVSF
jgi:hypothetical protein